MATGIGETLREAREGRGLSLDDAAVETRIRATHLEALEREEFDRIGDDVYVRGFIRSYAKAVGVDPESLLEDHRTSRPARPVEQPPAPLTAQSLDRTPRAGLGLVAAAAAVAVIVGLAVWGGGSADPVDMDDDPLAGTDTEQEPDDGAGSDLTATPTPSPTPPSPTPPPPEATESDTDDDRDDETDDRTGQERVELTVGDREVWARALVNDEEVWQELLSPGSVRRLDAAGEIRLRLGDAGAVELTVDGRSEGAPGEDGQPVWVTITRDNEVEVR